LPPPRSLSLSLFSARRNIKYHNFCFSPARHTQTHTQEMKLIFSACICAYDYITSREQSPLGALLHQIPLCMKSCFTGYCENNLANCVLLVAMRACYLGPSFASATIVWNSARQTMARSHAWLSGSSPPREIYFADLTNIIIDSSLSPALPQAAARSDSRPVCVCFKCHMSPCAVFCSSPRRRSANIF
jgi:hypothetical protein